MIKTFFCPVCGIAYQEKRLTEERTCLRCGKSCICVVYTPKCIYISYLITFFVFGTGLYGIASLKFGIGSYGMFSLAIAMILFPIGAFVALSCQPTKKVLQMFKQGSPKRKCYHCGREIPSVLKICPYCQQKG